MHSVLFLLIGGVAVGAPPLDPAPDVVGEGIIARVKKKHQETDDDGDAMDAMPGGSVVVTIQRRVIIRVPSLPAAAVTTPPPAERRALLADGSPPKALPRPGCLALRTLRGAYAGDRAGIVLLTTLSSNYRATLEKGCRSADFQAGFYLEPAADGALCAGRDILHARTGASCVVTAFRRLDGR